jgi:hypothetical protein
MYLGLPISDIKLSMEQWLFRVRKLAARVEPWWGKFMSSGGRLILSNSCLTSLPVFVMGMFLLQGPLVGKASSVAHQKMILWRMGGAPQKLRH